MHGLSGKAVKRGVIPVRKRCQGDKIPSGGRDDHFQAAGRPLSCAEGCPAFWTGGRRETDRRKKKDNMQNVRQGILPDVLIFCAGFAGACPISRRVCARKTYFCSFSRIFWQSAPTSARAPGRKGDCRPASFKRSVNAMLPPRFKKRR